MKKYLILLSLLTIAAFTGCTAIKDTVYTPDSVEKSSVVAIESLPSGDLIVTTTTNGIDTQQSLIAASALDPKLAGLVKPATTTPSPSLIKDDSKVVVENGTLTKVTPLTYKTSASVEAGTSLLGTLPIPFAGTISAVLNGILLIGGGWLAKNKITSDKVKGTISKTIDAYFDVVAKTESGTKHEEAIHRLLVETAPDEKTLRLAQALIKQYETPDKTKINI